MRIRRVFYPFFFCVFLCFLLGMLVSPLAAVPAGPAQRSFSKASHPMDEASIPGPMRSFLRMAAISQQIAPDELLPLLARNVVMNGYEVGRPTQFLVLLNWYMDQARELETLAGKEHVLHVSNCDDAKPLLAILGYRLQKSCGPDAALETADANRAFLTVNSGFPLADLEDALREGKPFDTAYAPTKVPVLYKNADWVPSKKNSNRSVVDAILRDPNLARLYWAMSRMDSETGQFLWQSVGAKKLILVAPVLDFYGSQISVRSGRVLVPGGTQAESAWKDLIGASPRSPADFITRLLIKDGGWAASYYDTLSRVDASQQAYFISSRHMQHLYDALRGHDINPLPTRHSFRPDPGLFLLESRLLLNSNGQPHIPGNIEVWQEVMRRKVDSKLVREWGEKSGSWNNPEQVIEGMVAVTRYPMPDGPVFNFLMLNEIDRNRSPKDQLSVPTAKLLADRFPLFGDQYPMFAEFPSLSNESITRFLTVAEGLNQIPDHLARTDALGMMQASIGLWEILARQGEIPDAQLNESWEKVLIPFTTLHTSEQVYQAGRASLAELLRAATGKTYLSQDQLFALLAGPEQYTKEGQQLRLQMARRMHQVIDDQRLVSLDTLISLGDGLDQMAKGKEVADSLLPLAGELREFELPRPLFTKSERNEYAGGIYSNRHTALQMRTDLIRIIKSPASPAELVQAHALLTPFLRDTLVGLNYAYYEPPGAQMIHNNPLFVRSHDFSGGDYSGEAATATDQIWRTPRIFGRGWTASGGAHLIGSMADLPYALARVEQDFIVPKNVQSLIWEDLVPGLITSAVLPRWWSVSRNEMHAVALYQRTGEELLSSAAKDEKVREQVLSIISDRLLPQRLEQIEAALRAGQEEEALALLAPSETFYLAAEFRHTHSSERKAWGPAGNELDDVLVRYPIETNLDRISQDFGVPHPALAQNYHRELMTMKPVPTFLYYSSRLMAESWDSGNLYWGRLADEMGYSPMMLNILVPELTRRMVEQTFASHLEDWSAVLRAMRETGEEFRQGKIVSLARKSPSAGL
ncbi:MAG TPA: hypothetical protein VK709_11230 [Candidatus Saccharimonadales bacterium]|jgi:hypothetical protein|nr:hypothetical protein [Candidatus Saccharimonadales bacterium]